MKIRINSSEYVRSLIKTYIEDSGDVNLKKLAKEINCSSVTLTGFYGGFKTIRLSIANKVCVHLTKIDLHAQILEEIRGLNPKEITSKGIQHTTLREFLEGKTNVYLSTVDRMS